MKRNGLGLIVLVLLVLVLFLSCAPKATPLPEAAREETATRPLEKAPWEQEWENLVRAAKREGVVTLQGSFNPTTRDALMGASRDKFGIGMDIIIGKSAQLITKMLTERRAGLFLVDIYVGGPTDLVNIAKPQGLLEPLDKVLFRPDVIDDNVWRGGLYFDRDRMLAGSTGDIGAPIAINANVVKSEEIQSYNDLLNPKWKGKIIMLDPTYTGPQVGQLIAVWKKMGREFIEELLKKQNITFTRDQRLQMESLARGKYSLEEC